ncbi:MAG: Hsp20/alpha crystallin family protein [Firmicutes bacterium]|nr:Hsp20/alpha crystallin family protein [Bacillota bacterium]
MSMERWRPADYPVSRRYRPESLFDYALSLLGRPFWLSPWEERERGLIEPAVDVFETDQHMVVKAELPGIDPRDLRVTVTEDSVEFRGEAKEEREERHEGYHWRERRHGLVQRLIPLARRIDPESARASFRNGVLTIRAVKSGSERGRTVRVEVESEPTGYGETH